MRNILVHYYFAVDVEEVWSTVETDLPVLKTQLSEMAEELRDG